MSIISGESAQLQPIIIIQDATGAWGVQPCREISNAALSMPRRGHEKIPMAVPCPARASYGNFFQVSQAHKRSTEVYVHLQ